MVRENVVCKKSRVDGQVFFPHSKPHNKYLTWFLIPLFKLQLGAERKIKGFSYV
jgi:hypothetical protein